MSKVDCPILANVSPRATLGLLCLAALAWAQCVATVAAGDENEVPGADITRAVNRSIALIQTSAAKYLDERTCFSCHHQGMSAIALSEVRTHGFKIDEKILSKQLERAASHLARGKENYLKGRGQGGAADTAGYALWALAAGGQAADDTTAAVTHYLLARDKDRDHWRRSGNRPPSEASHVTTTALAVRGLRDFGTDAQAGDIAIRNKQTLAWLRKTKPADTEDRVFRLQGLSQLEADEKVLANAARDLVAMQRDDGGWAQTGEMKSDAYATGTALVALGRYGGLSASDPAYRRGIRFLLATQHPDGSWHVKSRSKPFQKYFESGFPHGKDQFISMAATCWATIALAMGK